MEDVIDRTNRFYIEMSKNVLTEKEYDLLCKLLIEKIPAGELVQTYGVTEQYIAEIYNSAFTKVKNLMELLAEIEHYQDKLQKLKSSCRYAERRNEKEQKKKLHNADRSRLLSASVFPLSRRMQSFFEAMELRTFGDLADIPLKDLFHFRGFKTQLQKEFTAFVESEHMEHLFKGFRTWKARPMG